MIMKPKLLFSKYFSVLFFILTVSLGWSMPAAAMDLQQTKEMGAVGETQSGYLGIVNSAVSGGVKSLVADINKKRKSKYQEIAKRNATSVSAVEKLAGKKAIARTPSGQYIMSSSGKWIKK